MLQNIRKYLKKGSLLAADSCRFLATGWKRGQLVPYIKTYAKLAQDNVQNFHRQLATLHNHQLADPDKLQKRVQGLHSLLPDAKSYSYSILILLDDPNPTGLVRCLESTCKQTAPDYEVLIGIHGTLSSESSRALDTIASAFPEKVRIVEGCNHLNRLAATSTKKYLLIVDQHDWIRPDLLYRYEQVLRASDHKDLLVIQGAIGMIGKGQNLIPGKITHAAFPPFPYAFVDTFDLRGLMVPKALWMAVGGIRTNAADLILQLDARGASFQSIRHCFYGSGNQKSSVELTELKEAFAAYAQKKNLDWSLTIDEKNQQVRAIPKVNEGHTIQVVIPFKEQKSLTLSCVHSLLKQTGVSLKITAVDNGSCDRTIAAELKNLGAEVIEIQEPFNFSRLNNQAVALSKTAQKCDLVLFLNNDVELERDAIEEMMRWIDQPGIGIVGCRLDYPDGRLQHGGIELMDQAHPELLWWHHTEKFSLQEELQRTKGHCVVDAVTAACALMKKSIFLEVGGFDEVYYPIGYSDTDLAVKLQKRGLLCFYTPYARGVHHESVTRKDALEDVEQSRWFSELIR